MILLMINFRTWGTWWTLSPLENKRGFFCLKMMPCTIQDSWTVQQDIQQIVSLLFKELAKSQICTDITVSFLTYSRLAQQSNLKIISWLLALCNIFAALIYIYSLWDCKCALHIGPYWIAFFCFLFDVLICHMKFIYSSLSNNFFQIPSRNSSILWRSFTSIHQVDCTCLWSAQFWNSLKVYLTIFSWVIITRNMGSSTGGVFFYFLLLYTHTYL